MHVNFIHKVYISLLNRLYLIYAKVIYRGLRNKIISFYSSNYDYRGNDECMYNDLKSKAIYTKDDYRSKGEASFLNPFWRIMPKYFMNTGGSTGNPYEFWVSTKCSIVDTFHQEAQHLKIGFVEQDRIFVINGCTIDDNHIRNNIFWKKKNNQELPFGSVEFSSHYLNYENSIYYVNELIIQKPAIIRSYPSVFVELTKYIKLLGYDNPPFILKGIQLTSEVISEQDHEYLVNFWGDIIYYQYGHSEAATIASKFPYEDCYTFSPYYGLVEILDDNGNHVNKGEEGRIIVTSIHNKVRPFIRYDTGDLAVFKSNDKNVIKVYSILGRNQDYVIDRKGNKISITGLVFGQHFKAFANILKWQILNDIKGHLIVKIIKLDSFDDDNFNELKDKLSFNNSFDVEILFVSDIEKTSRGKHKLVINEVE
ncbi:TPA: hypothetical protein ACX6PX_003585 [Photobacterium damselae]